MLLLRLTATMHRCCSRRGCSRRNKRPTVVGDGFTVLHQTYLQLPPFELNAMKAHLHALGNVCRAKAHKGQSTRMSIFVKRDVYVADEIGFRRCCFAKHFANLIRRSPPGDIANLNATLFCVNDTACRVACHGHASELVVQGHGYWMIVLAIRWLDRIRLGWIVYLQGICGG